jgi:hypothetical protein
VIRIEFTGSAGEVREEMRALLGMAREPDAPEQADANLSEAKKPATRKSTKASAEGNAETKGDATSAQTTTSSKQGSAGSASSPPSDGEITRATVEPKCMAFSQKGGAQALKELFIEMGSPAGKWSAIPDENLPALNARLDELLAG